MNHYEAPELLSVGAISEVVLGEKIAGGMEGDIFSFTPLSVLDVE
jgi:hypothetical protein